MDDSNLAKAETNKTKESYQNLIMNESFNRNRPLINIQEQFSLILSYANQETIDILLIIDILKNICHYYTDSQIQKDYDIILQNQEICESLISLISNQEERLPLSIYILKTILIFVSLNKDISVQLAELKLFDLFIQILEEDQVNNDMYIYISKIIIQMLLYHDEQINELLLKSSLISSIIDKLSKFSEIKLSKQENLYLVDFLTANNNDFKFSIEDLYEKYPSDIISIENKQKLIEQYTIETFIFSFIDCFLKLCGNLDNETYDNLLISMAELISNLNHKFLTTTISHVLIKMIMASNDILIKSFEINFPYILNEQLGVDEYEIEWPFILEFDITVLKCVQDDFFIDVRQEIIEKIYEYANPQLLYSLINYTKETSGNKKSIYQQKLISQVFCFYSDLFNSINSIIVENDDDEIPKTDLSLQQFLDLADTLEYYEGYDTFLLKGYILFIFTAFDTQDIFSSHIDIMDAIFSKYNDDILSVLLIDDINLKKLMLKVFIKLTIKFFEDECQSETIASLLTSTELNDFAQNCISDFNNETDDELKTLSEVFIEKTSDFFKEKS